MSASDDRRFDPTGRRRLLKVMSVGIPVAVVGTVPLAANAQNTVGRTVSGPMAAQPHVWRFFNPDEVRAVEAAVARLIPADDIGPGAKEASVAVFIDMQLAGAWGQGDNLYRAGPFVEGTPQQGYQLSFTPSAMFRFGLAKLDAAAAAANAGRRFAELPSANQDELLAKAERGELDFAELPSPLFFAALLDATVEGFFSDPIYGGNADMVGWKLVGFPGVYASYSSDIERHGVAWTRPPVSIADGDAGHQDMGAH